VVADFSDLRKLHILTDKLRRLVHILKLNIRIGCQLGKEMSRISTASLPALHINFAGIQMKLDRFLLGQETSVSRIETLIARSSGIGQLVSLYLPLEYLNSEKITRRCRVYKIFGRRMQASESISRCRS
jgi:hypothetical protein